LNNPFTRIIAGTGHRPKVLGGYGNDTLLPIIELLCETLTKLRPDKVISGMALGFDQALALAAIKLHIPFIAAVPHDGQESIWPESAQRKYKFILDRAETVAVICPGEYAREKMQKRNEWMVDNADLVLALWNGQPGGTANCINYARKTGKKIMNLYDDWVIKTVF